MASWVSIRDVVDTRRPPRNPEKRRLWLGQPDSHPRFAETELRPSLELRAEHSTPAPEAAPDSTDELALRAERAAADAVEEPQTEMSLLRQRVDLLERERTELLIALTARRREVSELHVLLQRSLDPQPAQSPAPQPEVRQRNRFHWLRAWLAS